MGIAEEILAAIKENTATLKALSGKTAETAKLETKPAAKSETKPATKPAAEEEPKRGRGRPPKEKSLSVTEMAEKAREFAEAAEDDEDEFKARRKFLSEQAKEFGAAKFSEIKGDDQAKALKALADYEDGEDEGEGDGEGEADY